MMVEPVAGVDVEAPWRHLHPGGTVGVAEKHQIQLVIVEELIASPPLQFQVSGRPGSLGGTGGSNLGSGDAPSHGRAHIRMEPAEGPACQARSENPTKCPVSQVPSTQAVSMRHEAAAARELPGERLPVEVQADLVGEVGSTPPIMVASHEVDRHAAVHDLGQKPEGASVPSGDHAAIFKPEIEEIPIDEKCRSLWGRPSEPTVEGSGRGVRYGSEVHIARDEHWRIVHRR